MTIHDQINKGPVTAAYTFNSEPNPVNQAARLPDRPSFPAQRSLEQAQADEITYLSKDGKKGVSKETRTGVLAQTPKRPNYEAIIALNGNVSKFFNRDGFRVKDVFVYNSPMNGQSYTDANGKTVEIHSGTTSSFNRLADTVTLLRKVEGAGESFCYAGRADQAGPTPTAKAEEVAQMIFIGEFDGQGGKGIEKIGEDTYTLQFAVQSTIGSSPLPILRDELNTLRDEIKSYQLLVEKTETEPMTIVHPETGKQHYVKVLPPLMSQTQFNWINQLSLLTDSLPMGDLHAQEISQAGDAILFEKASKSQNEAARDTAELLKQGGHKPWEEIMLRAYLCHLLNIPEVIHCKSSVDRTGVAVGIVSSMRQWLQSGKSIPLDANGKHNILKIVSEFIVDKEGKITYPFKELFACNFRKGLIETELSRDQRGLKVNRGWSQTMALQDLVPSRYLKPYDAKDLLQRVIVRVSSFILSIFTIIFTLGGILKAIQTKSLKGFDVWLAPFKAFRTDAFPQKLVDETTEFGKDLIFKSSKK